MGILIFGIEFEIAGKWLPYNRGAAELARLRGVKLPPFSCSCNDRYSLDTPPGLRPTSPIVGEASVSSSHNAF